MNPNIHALNPKINFAVWRARLTLAAGYLFAGAAALQTGIAGLPPLLPLLPQQTRTEVAAAIAVLLTLQAVQTRVQHPLTVQEPPSAEKDVPSAEADNQPGQ